MVYVRSPSVKWITSLRYKKLALYNSLELYSGYGLTVGVTIAAIRVTFWI